MRTPRLLAGVLAALLSVALVGAAPTQAVALGDPSATTVTGACTGGPGRVSLVVHPTAGGRYVVEVNTRGLAEGSRWTGQVSQRGDAEARTRDFRRVAVDGGWTVVTRFPATAGSDDDVFFGVDARERGDRGHHCYVLNSPASPVAGLAECNKLGIEIVVLAHEREDGSTAVRSLIFDVRPNSRWHLTVTATGAAGRQVVDFDDRAGRRQGLVRSRVVHTGLQDPRVRVVASNEDYGRCFIKLNPPNASTTDAPLTLRGLNRLSDFRA